MQKNLIFGVIYEKHIFIVLHEPITMQGGQGMEKFDLWEKTIAARAFGHLYSTGIICLCHMLVIFTMLEQTAIKWLATVDLKGTLQEKAKNKYFFDFRFGTEGKGGGSHPASRTAVNPNRAIGFIVYTTYGVHSVQY